MPWVQTQACGRASKHPLLTFYKLPVELTQCPWADCISINAIFTLWSVSHSPYENAQYGHIN